MTRYLEFDEFDELAEALQSAPEIALPIMRKRMNTCLLLIESRVRDVPDQPNRERARTFNRWVRGVGIMPMRAFNRPGRGGKTHAVSEDLSQRWAHQAEVEPDGVTGIIGNTASYAEAVQGSEQLAYHAQTGWPTLGGAIDELEADILDEFSQGVAEILGGIAVA